MTWPGAEYVSLGDKFYHHVILLSSIMVLVSYLAFTIKFPVLFFSPS